MEARGGGPAGGGSSRRSDEWAGERESAALSLSENICARRKQWRRERREMHALALPLPTAHKMACRRPRDRARAPALRLRSCARACRRGLARAFCRSAALTPAPPSTSGRACSLHAESVSYSILSAIIFLPREQPRCLCRDTDRPWARWGMADDGSTMWEVAARALLFSVPSSRARARVTRGLLHPCTRPVHRYVAVASFVGAGPGGR